LPKAGFIEGLRSICNEIGSLLIFDEVITGFRHGLGGFQTIINVMPDITAVGKALGNGFPVAAIAGRRELMEQFNTHPHGKIMFAGTYNGNAVAAAAGLSVVEILQDPAIYEHVFKLGAIMREGLTDILKRRGVTGYVSGFGSIYVLNFMEGPLESYEDVLRNDAGRQIRYRQELIKRGVFEMPERGGRNHISAAHSESDITQTLEIAEEALVAATV
jgi:glutamate-1-semialdehyde 2,1-aminomutase